jgi:transposase-like protein
MNALDTESEVIGKVAKRRSFSNAEKQRILAAADSCTRSGELGALLRKEGVYSSSLSTWRRQRENAELEALAANKRGPKVPANRAELQQIAKLTREIGRLQGELDKTMLIIGVQEKLAALLGRPVEDETGSS